MDYSWLSVIPPLLAIILAVWSKQVYPSIMAGIFSGWIIVAGGNPFVGVANTINGIVGVFQDRGDTEVIIFCALVGSLMALMQKSGGFEGFINLVMSKNIFRRRRSAQALAGAVGLTIFVETSINSLIVGSIFRPVFDRLKISREKLAYICDSTSAPVNVLFPFNAWGAFVLGLLLDEGIKQPILVLISSLAFNFYPIIALIFLFILVWSKRDFGPMLGAQRRVLEEGKILSDEAKPLISKEVLESHAKQGVEPKASNMLIPVLLLVISMPLFLFITGDGDITRGSGSTSVLWAVVTAIGISSAVYLLRGVFDLNEITNLIFKGIGGLIPLVILMLLAFAFGDVTRELGTGVFIANVTSLFLHPVLIPALLFIASGAISFSTGTSWGTFAIMIPIAVPLSSTMDISLAMTLAAVLGGGVFGDHCSPISDTTLISSMAAATDHLDHVKTQLPYALICAGAAIFLYLIVAIVA